MLKGVNKLIVEINNPESEYFEKAIFFVRPSKTDVPPAELSNDADIILAGAEIRREAEKNRKKRKAEKVLKICLWIGGVLISAGVALMMML